MMKSFNDVKKIIALLTSNFSLLIKNLDPTSKYSAIVLLEETIDILKLEALKELPQSEEDIKDEDVSLDIDHEDIESKASDEANETLQGKKNLCDYDTKIDSTDNNSEKCHANSTNQELAEEREPALQVLNSDIEEEQPKLQSVPEEDSNSPGTVITIEDDDDANDIYSHLSTRMNLRLDSADYDCKICPKVLSSRRGLIIHYNIHAGKFTCHRCKAPFSAKRELDKHITNHLNCLKLQKLRSYTNPQEWIVDPSNPILHPELSETKNPSKPSENNKDQPKKPTSFYCDPCNLYFSTPYNLRNHQKKPKHQAKVPKIVEIPQRTEPVQDKEVAKEVDTLHTPPKTTDKVDKEVKTRPSSQNTTEEKEKLLQCPDCPNLYSNRRSLLNHQQQHTDKYKCPKCKSTFPSPSPLAKHNCDLTLRRRSSTSIPSIGGVGVECNECGMRFGRNKKHLLKDHQIEHTDKFKCHSCSFGFLSARVLARHLKLEKCKNVGRRRNTLIKRSRLLYSAPEHEEKTLEEDKTQLTPQNNKDTSIAIGVASSECLECGMRFFKKNRMKMHKLEHTNEFKCHTCSFGFSSIRALARHLSNKENCKHIKYKREAMIKKSRILYSPPKSKSKRHKSFSDVEKLHLQKITNNSFNFSGPVEVDAKKAHTDLKSEANQTSETQSKPADVVSLKEPDTECPTLKILETHSLSGITSPIKNKSSTLQILNHNFPGVTFHPEIKC